MLKKNLNILALDSPETPGEKPECDFLEKERIPFVWREGSGLSPGELDAALGECDILLTRTAPVDESMIGKMRRCLAIIQYGPGGSGSAPVALEAARMAGIYVGSLPSYASDLWGKRTMELIKIACKTAVGRGARPIPEKGLRIGLMGFGEVGRRVSRLAQRHGVSIHAHDPFVNPEHFDNHGVERVEDPAQLAGMVHVLSLHLPLYLPNRGLLGAAKLSLMQPGSLLVVTSSPELIDMAALGAGLEAMRPAAVAFDAPLPPAHPLIDTPGVLAGPQSVGSTLEARWACRRRAGEIIAGLWRGQRPIHMRIDPPCPRHALAIAGAALD